MAKMPATQTRGFLFADLRDYTAFVEAHGDSAAAELLSRYRKLVRDVISEYEGAEIRTEGDSFYVTFSSATAAIYGGLAILERAAAPGEPGVPPIRVGIGLHAGETTETADGLVGSAVNLAARLCSLARPGEMLVSETVRGLTRTIGVRFAPKGRRRLKGIAEPMRIYRVLPAGQAMTTSAARGGAWERRPAWQLAAWGVLGVALAVVVMGTVAAMLSATGPFTRRESESPPASATGTGTAPVGVALTAEEEALRAKLPSAVSADCGPATAAEGSTGGTVALRCALPLSAAADEVWFDQFATADALSRAFSDAVAVAQAPAGDCQIDTPAWGPWEVPNVHAGNLLCYQRGGEAWLVWTYQDDRILSQARRGDGDVQALTEWWRATAYFLR